MRKMLILGVVLVLALVGVVACGGDEKEPAATSPEAEVAQPAVVQPTDVPKATDVPPPTEKPSSYAIGDVIDVGDGMTMMVESATKTGADELVAVIVMDNTAGTKDQSVSSMLSFEVKDDAGNKGQQTILFDNPTGTGGLDGSVIKGDKLRGYIAWQSGLGTGLKLYYAPSIMSSDRIVVDLGQ
jgi:hypothetical protein